jgi:hypothetical protein
VIGISVLAQRVSLWSLVVAGGLLVAAPAFAQLEFVIDTSVPNPSDPRWVVCYTWDRETDDVYVSSINQTTYADTESDPTERWRDFLAQKVKLSDRPWGGCNTEKSEADANWRRGVFLEQDPNFPPKNMVELEWTMPPAKLAKKGSKPASAKPVKEAKPAPVPAEPKKSAAQIDAEERAARAAEREAEFQRKHEEYERGVAERNRQVEEYDRAKEAMARKQAEQKAAVDQAAAEYAQRMEAHSAEAERYESEREAAAAKLRADFDARHGLGQSKKEEASTDTDANRCVTTAETQLNATFKGNTAASVVNGRGQPVDLRICLMSTKGWNCGVTWGLASQAKWSYSSFNATGQVFVDARVSGSSKPLASPN